MAPSSQEERDERADHADRALGLEAQHPSPNAFAMAEVQRHRYMLQANAFYQEDWRARENAPRDLPHPAFTQPDLISNLSLPIPRLPPQAQLQTQTQARQLAPQQQPQHLAPHPPRESNVTTFSPFIMAGDQEESPPLNLGTTPKNTPQPTQRAFIEERNEQRRHERSGATNERIPVFHPSPALPGEGFQRAHTTPMPMNATNAAADATDAATAGPRTTATREKAVTFAPETNTSAGKKSKTDDTPNKGGLLNRMFGKKSSAADRPPTPTPEAPSGASTKMGPKAAQILGANIPRSPSKSKGFFSRRTSDANEIKKNQQSDAEQGRSKSAMGSYSNSGSTSSRTGNGGNDQGRSQSSMGNSSKNSGSVNNRTGGSEPSSTRSRQGTPNVSGLSRHLSLRGMEQSIPPTPPSKDTPPDEPIRRYLGEKTSALGISTMETPSRTTGFVSSGSFLSPARDGTFGQRDFPKLQTAPSMHSLRGSVAVAPRANDPALIREMASRVGPLNIEGFALPSETRTRQESIVTYSPSVYADDFDSGIKPMAQIPTRIDEVLENEEVSPSRVTNRHSRSMSMTTQNTTATSGTIPMIYPDLVNDQSIVDSQRFELTPPSVKPTPSMRTAFKQVEDALEQAASTSTSAATKSTPTPGEKKQRYMVKDVDTGRQIFPSGMLQDDLREQGFEQTPPADLASSIDESKIHPAFRKGSAHLPPTFFDPEGRTLQKPAYGEDNGVQKMVKALEQEHSIEQPKGKGKEKVPNVFENAPDLSPVTVFTASDGGGGGLFRRLSRFKPRSRRSSHASGDLAANASDEATETAAAPPDNTTTAGDSTNDNRPDSPTSPPGSPVPKRIGSNEARNWYLPDNGAHTPAETSFSEQSTIIQTPNLPDGFVRPPGGGQVTSSDLTGHQTRPRRHPERRSSTRLSSSSSVDVMPGIQEEGMASSRHTPPASSSRGPTASSSRAPPPAPIPIPPPPGLPPAGPPPPVPGSTQAAPAAAPPTGGLPPAPASTPAAPGNGAMTTDQQFSKIMDLYNQLIRQFGDLQSQQQQLRRVVDFNQAHVLGAVLNATQLANHAVHQVNQLRSEVQQLAQQQLGHQQPAQQQQPTQFAHQPTQQQFAQQQFAQQQFAQQQQAQQGSSRDPHDYDPYDPPSKRSKNPKSPPPGGI